jgi:predicted TIM-barrel fold metal-dependent hydrolase
VSEEPFVIISSDGHAGALMADYRPYLDEPYREEFDSFLTAWNEHGARAFDLVSLARRTDQEFVDGWKEKMFDTGRVNGFSDSAQRLREVEKEGVSAEVLFPDFGIPFQLANPSSASQLGLPPLDEEHRRAGMRAFNRWLVDYISVAPERFAGMAAVSWQWDIDDAVAEVHWAHAAGLKGIVLPEFDPELPLYLPDFEPVWNTLEELNMVVTSHAGISSTSNRPIYTPGAPHPACAFRIYTPEVLFFCHNILSHMIWGGVLERHPTLKFCPTEQGSGWVVPLLESLDYVYDGSYFRTDFHEMIRSKPSEYFARQCFLGSSIFSRAEIMARHQIGLDNMMLGMDFPHHEGTLIESTQEYLKATIGVADVPIDEARKLLGLVAAEVYDFDLAGLTPVAERIGLKPEEVLTHPERDLYPRGDVNKPASMFV